MSVAGVGGRTPEVSLRAGVRVHNHAGRCRRVHHLAIHIVEQIVPAVMRPVAVHKIQPAQRRTRALSCAVCVCVCVCVCYVCVLCVCVHVC